jgi:hypothetical protein
LEAAVSNAPENDLRVDVIHARIWPWARQHDAEAVVSEKGGCACSLLADDADWDADVWSMRPEVLEPLARTLLTLTQLGPEGMVIEALWQGEVPEREETVTPAELATLARTSQLGTHTRYHASKHSA